MAERQTLIANLIDETDVKARYDRQAKRLLANTAVLAWLLRSCIDEFHDFDVDYIMRNCFVGAPELSTKAVHMDMPDGAAKDRYVQSMNSESSSIEEHTVHYDIRFKTRVPDTDRIVELIINVEVQVDSTPGYPILKRGIYYCSRMLSEQFGTEFLDEHYEDMKKVVSIWICPTPTASKRDSVVEAHIHAEEIYGSYPMQRSDYDLMQIVIISLNDEQEDSKRKIIRLLSVLLSGKETPEEKKRILEEEFEIAMTEELESGVLEMCNLSQAVEMRAKQERNIEMAEDMLKKNLPIALIEEISKLSEETVRSIAQRLGIAVVE